MSVALLLISYGRDGYLRRASAPVGEMLPDVDEGIHTRGRSWIGSRLASPQRAVAAAHGFLTPDRTRNRRRPSLTLPEAVLPLQPLFKRRDGRCHTCQQSVELHAIPLTPPTRYTA